MSVNDLFPKTSKVLAVFLISGLFFSSIGWNTSTAKDKQAEIVSLAGNENNTPANSPALTITPASGGTLRFPLIGTLETLDPALLSTPNEALIELQIFEGLTQLDQNNNVVPAIASSWSSPDA